MDISPFLLCPGEANMKPSLPTDSGPSLGNKFLPSSPPQPDERNSQFQLPNGIPLTIPAAKTGRENGTYFSWEAKRNDEILQQPEGKGYWDKEVGVMNGKVQQTSQTCMAASYCRPSMCLVLPVKCEMSWDLLLVKSLSTEGKRLVCTSHTSVHYLRCQLRIRTGHSESRAAQHPCLRGMLFCCMEQSWAGDKEECTRHGESGTHMKQAPSLRAIV